MLGLKVQEERQRVEIGKVLMALSQESIHGWAHGCIREMMQVFEGATV